MIFPPVQVQKGLETPIHNQLVTQLALQIAGGELPEGTKLPSVRHMAKKLDIHYNTVHQVYKELAELGMVEIRAGSGVRVRKATEVPSTITRSKLEQHCRTFLQAMAVEGFQWPDVLAELQKIGNQMGTTHTQAIYFVDEHPDIMPVFLHELSTMLGQTVHGVALKDIQATSFPQNGHILVSRYHHQNLMEALHQFKPQGSMEVHVLEISKNQHLRDKIKSLPDGAFVTLISGSTILLQMAVSVVDALRGDSLLVRTITTHGHDIPWDEIQHTYNHTHMYITDATLTDNLEKRLKPKPLEVMEMIATDSTEELNSKVKGSA